MKDFIIVIALFVTLTGCFDSGSGQDSEFEVFENSLVPNFIFGDSVSVSFNIEDRMDVHDVQGISVAIGDNGEVVYEKGFGVKSSNSKDLVDQHTIFQVASLSKAVTAVGVLRLVENYNLSLSEDVNEYLKDWKLDHGEWQEDTVSISRLLRHEGGVIDRGFDGYKVDQTLPSILEILNGLGNREEITVNQKPGEMRYSGGGYLVLQYLIEQVGGATFSEYMQKEVFDRIGMFDSSYSQRPKGNFSYAHDENGDQSKDGWLAFPELAAAGLWSTAGDLTRFCQAIVLAYQDKPNAILSKTMVDKMLDLEKGWGLGVGLRKSEGSETLFFHGGSNPGSFKALMICPFESGQSIAVLSNSKNGALLNDEIIASFGNFYNTNPSKVNYYKEKQLTEYEQSAVAGRYQFREEGDYYLQVSFDNNKMIFEDLEDGMREEYMPLDGLRFVNKENGGISRFHFDSISNEVTKMHWGDNYTFYKVNI